MRVENSDPRTEVSDDGNVQTVTAILRLSKEDQGLLVGCHSEQWDKSEPRVSLATKDNVGFYYLKQHYMYYKPWCCASLDMFQLSSA